MPQSKQSQKSQPRQVQSKHGQNRRILYRTPDYSEPSWGVGLIYGHVRLLQTAGLDAWVLHERPGFVAPWLPEAAQVPRLGRLDPDFCYRPSDILVIPEIDANDLPELEFPGTPVLFVQGTLPLISAAPTRASLHETGCQTALVTMPHLAFLAERFYDLDTYTVPPFVAQSFFDWDNHVDTPRERLVLLHVKEQIDQLGFPDRRLIEQFWQEHAPPGWRLERFSGLDHDAVAKLMQRAALQVNLNLVEGFNATVAEAMAAGCINLTYHAIGGRDYLVGNSDEQNAFVFDNGDVVSLADRLFTTLAAYDKAETQQKLKRIRRNGYQTAEQYREKQTARALLRFYEALNETEVP